ncbi:hypothetical protein CT19425_U600098 [Cupriavidus taiwanensis]|uniref:Transposase n=1 Tax=Cupriavidus taiwanensis TaxID=164546 RepID=A0A375I732_9BURK|nr:hypothetical protein CT19425_U600098 [Cupriavidus taiwanensis]
MARPEVITVSMREIDRLKTVQAVMDGQLRPGVAAERLEITDRQLRRLLERYRLEGPAGLVSRKRGLTQQQPSVWRARSRSVRPDPGTLCRLWPDPGRREAARASWADAV